MSLRVYAALVYASPPAAPLKANRRVPQFREERVSASYCRASPQLAVAAVLVPAKWAEALFALRLVIIRTDANRQLAAVSPLSRRRQRLRQIARAH